MNIKLASSKPHKKYIVEASGAQIKELCRFLRKQKEKQLELIFNGKSIKFNSVAGIKRYATGLEHGAKIVDDQVAIIWREHTQTISNLKSELGQAKKEAKTAKDELNEATSRYMSKYSLMKIRKAMWDDHVAELQDDRAILKEELDRLKKPKPNPKPKKVTKRKTKKRGKKRAPVNVSSHK